MNADILAYAWVRCSRELRETSVILVAEDRGREALKMIQIILSHYIPDHEDLHKVAKLPYLVHEATPEQD